MAYKVGDKVKVRDIAWYHKNNNSCGGVRVSSEGAYWFTELMSGLCGKWVTISKVEKTVMFPVAYRIREDKFSHNWQEYMFEDKLDYIFEDKKGEDMETNQEIKVFTYKDVEEAERYIGQEGYFSGSLSHIEKGTGIKGILSDVIKKEEEAPFYRGLLPSQFFKPLKLLKDPEYVPYTLDDAKEFRDLWVKRTSIDGEVFRISGYSIAGVYIGDYFITYQNAVGNLTKEDGTPFGKLVP